MRVTGCSARNSAGLPLLGSAIAARSRANMGAVMTVTDSLRAISILLVLGAGSASAQSVASPRGPLEIPPTGFAASHYVDSTGCRFRRVVMGGTVLWAPLVNRKRQQLCGYRPSVVQATSQPAAVVVPAVTVTRVSTAGYSSIGATPTRRVKIPKGYKAAWMDGRLNPHRGPRTAFGDAQMAQLWTDTVPAELIVLEATN